MKIKQQNNETIFEIHPLGKGTLFIFVGNAMSLILNNRYMEWLKRYRFLV